MNHELNIPMAPHSLPPSNPRPTVQRTLADDSVEDIPIIPVDETDETLANADLTTVADQEALTLAESGDPSSVFTQMDDGELAVIPREAGPDLLPPGYVLAGRYEVVKIIGAGGMARVYHARDLKFKGQSVAVKCLLAHLSANPIIKQRFHNEAVLARSLNHPNVVPIYDIFESETGLLCIAMAFLEGHDFRGWIHEHRAEPNYVPHALAIIRDACLALAHAHGKGAVHRDVKPENIFVTRENKVLMMDFGIAKLLQEIEGTEGYATTHHVTQSVVGTPAYMAPEQFEPGREIDGRADQYAMGVMLYEVLTGKLPTGRFLLPSEIQPSLGKFYDRLIETSLAQDPDQRFPGMEAFLATFEKSPHLPKSAGGWKMSPLAMAGAALAAGAVVLLVLFYLQHSLLLLFLAASLLVPVAGLGWLEWRSARTSGKREARTTGKILCSGALGLMIVGILLLLEKSW